MELIPLSPRTIYTQNETQAYSTRLCSDIPVIAKSVKYVPVMRFTSGCPTLTELLVQ